MIVLMFATAFALSTVAAFYAIFGLVAIFAAAPVAIIILGSLLEASKLVVASWLYRNWKQIPILLKTYFLIALVILMFLTSMGIFGFLSRAHIEQAATGAETQAQIDRLENEINRQNVLMQRAEERFEQLQTKGLGADANIQSQIDAEQQRIDSAYQRVQPAIDEQQRLIDNQTKLFENELAQIDQQLTQLQEYINTGDIRKAQAMVGARADGQFGPASAAAVRNWQEQKQKQRQSVLSKIESTNNNPTIKAAREEIQRLRSTVEAQIAQSNTLINRLRDQLGNSTVSEVETALNEQQEIIKASNVEIDSLTQQKYQLEADVRKLEVEVGPIKYIADMIYGDQADANTLEKAVRFMILLLVAVFDPLAVLLLIAANWTLLNTKHNFRLPQRRFTSFRSEDPQPKETSLQSEATVTDEVQPSPQTSPKPPAPKLDSDYWISRPHKPQKS